MDQAIDRTLSQFRPRITALLRTRGHYSVKDLIGQFKTQIWGIMEANNGGIFHAATTHLMKFDNAQRHFLRKLEVSEAEAFLKFNFAPPTLRRNIGILGLLHKRVIGQAHPRFESLLPWFETRYGFVNPGRHTKQLYSNVMEITAYLDLFKRSIFAMVDVYNHLPQYVIDSDSVSTFQKHLTNMVRTRCESSLPNWMFTFDKRIRH